VHREWVGRRLDDAIAAVDLRALKNIILTTRNSPTCTRLNSSLPRHRRYMLLPTVTAIQRRHVSYRKSLCGYSISWIRFRIYSENRFQIRWKSLFDLRIWKRI